MNAYKRYKNRLERFLQAERGKRTINFAYSFGAAIVILGAMFKLLHFPFGNEMLFIGMVTECVVFIISAFDTPIRDYNWEEVFPALSPVNSNKDSAAQNVIPHSGTIATSPTHLSPSASEPGIETHTLSAHTEEYGKQMENLNRTLSGLNSIYEIQLKSVSSQIGAIEQINLGLARLRNMYGDTLPDGSVIKTEVEKMANQLRELNDVYARMLNAMTVNRYNNPATPNL